MSHTIFCIVGESGSGKDTLTKLVNINYNLNLKSVVSFTTRPIRDTETDGVEHYFVDNEKYDEIHNSNIIVAETKIGDYRYMASYDELLKSDIYIIDPEGIKSLKKEIRKNHLDIRLVIIYIYSEFEDRKYRVTKNRGDKLDIFLKRYESEKMQFDRFRLFKEYDYIILNTGIDDKNLNVKANELFLIIDRELNK